MSVYMCMCVGVCMCVYVCVCVYVCTGCFSEFDILRFLTEVFLCPPYPCLTISEIFLISRNYLKISKIVRVLTSTEVNG